ncbi:MAG: MarR family transcriptional regulator [Actinomycetales bacterium]|nr:MarR family transcriptional regulator [Actinomycetales bacterium]
MEDEIARRLIHDGYDMRASDRAVFRRLATGTATGTVLARSLGISQQATSKALADLQLRGYVERQDALGHGASPAHPSSSAARSPRPRRTGQPILGDIRRRAGQPRRAARRTRSPRADRRRRST